MKLRYLPEPSIAPLSYCVRVNSEAVDVVHGAMVATTPGFFHDGAWAGDFVSGNFDTVYNCGTGGMLVGDVLRLVTPEMPIEGIFLFDGREMTLASNSFAFLMEVLDDQLDVNHFRYRDEMLAVERGVRLGPTTLTTAGGLSIRVLFDETADVAGPGDISIRQRPLSQPFTSWTEYRQHLSHTVSAVVANAVDAARPQAFDPLVPMSTGYDSCAVAVLAAEAGVSEGVTMMRYNADGTEPVDYPGAIAATLGLNLTEVERDGWRTRTDLPEANLAASLTTLGGVSLLALDDVLPGRLMLTGGSGDTVWSRENYRYFEDVVHGYGQLGGRSLAEHRLHVGYVRFSPPEVGHSAHPSIFALSSSEELEPWSIGGPYDRPIARRLVEEAGIPRSSFAVRKFGASAKVGHSQAHYELGARSHMAAGLLEIMSPASVESFLSFLDRVDPARYLRTLAFDAWGNRAYHKLDAFNHRAGMRLHPLGIRHPVPRSTMRWLGRRWLTDADYTRWLPHWGVAEVRPRYRGGAARLEVTGPAIEAEHLPQSPFRRLALRHGPAGVPGAILRSTRQRLTRSGALTWVDLTEMDIEPVEALQRTDDGRPLLRVPLDRLRHYAHSVPIDDLTLNPFARAAAEHSTSLDGDAARRILEGFYASWQPFSLAEVYGLSVTSGSGLNSPPSPDCLPWTEGANLADITAGRRAHRLRMARTLGTEDHRIHGYRSFGPVSAEAAELFVSDYTELTDSIADRGYVPSLAEPPKIHVLVHGDNWVGRLLGGNHRLAVLAALGHREVVVEVDRRVVSRDDVGAWPGVRSGLYTPGEALDVFDRFVLGDRPAGFPVMSNWATRVR